MPMPAWSISTVLLCPRELPYDGRRPVQIHFASGADRNTARLIYFGIGDEVYPNMYAISADEWDHDSSDESDSSLTLY